MATIELDRLSKSYSTAAGGDLRVLDEFSLQAADGEFLCLLGPSGCGKSTTLDILAGLTNADSGAVKVDGTAGWRDLTCGYVFQRPRLLNWRTVRKNLEFALAGSKIPRSSWKERVDHYLELVGLTEFADAYPLGLSGGMQQRVSLARALAIEPDVLLMDEPFSSLDELTARKLRVELLEIVARQETTVLFVTHNALEAAFLADRICVTSSRPARVVEAIEVRVPRPRFAEDEELVRVQRQVLELLDNNTTPSPESPVATQPDSVGA